MYIGARYVPIFADPVEWDDDREYEPLTIVVHDGNCYTSKCYVPKGAQLPPYPEGQTKYWVKTSDYNYQFANLKQAVADLSRLVEQFQKDNEHFTDLINGWNTKVEQWEKDMAAWGERLDSVESSVADLTASLNAEIDRAKAAEQANAAAIAQETADRKQAVSDLDAAYKAADAAEAQARADADTALSDRITGNKTDIDAIKAEQAIQNTNISANAKNISDNAAEIAKHAERLTDLESNASDWDEVFPNTTIAQEMQKEELARANADTALNGRCDTLAADVEEVRDLANHKVDTTTYTAGQAAQDAKITAAQAAADKANANIGDWETDHPSQTISQCVTSLENELAATDAKADANTAALANKADKSEIPDVSGLLPKTEAAETYQPKGEYALKSELPDTSNFVTKQTYEQGQAAQDAKINEANTTIGAWTENHPNTISEAVSNNTAAISELYANSGDTLATITASSYYIGSVADQYFMVRIPINKLLHTGQEVQFNGITDKAIAIERAAVYTTNSNTLTKLNFSKPATITHTATEVTVFGSLSEVKMMGPVLIYSLSSTSEIPVRTLIAK